MIPGNNLHVKFMKAVALVRFAWYNLRYRMLHSSFW